MLTKRIIPCLDVDKGRVVKGKKFKDIEDVDDPVSLAKFYSFIDVVERTAENINIPFCIGGGIRTIDDFTKVLRAGADKVSVNSAAVKRPELIREAALKFGSQCVVLSMDVKRNGNNSWDVYINGGRINTEKLGAGEIVLNSIDSDGVKEGYDIEITQLISEKVNIPVIASGGAGKMKDFLKVLNEGKADAALAASVFHYREIEIKDLKEYLYKNGIEVRRDF